MCLFVLNILVLKDFESEKMNRLKQSILIAEDNQFTALQYNRILGKYGHEVLITKDGEECLKKYRDACDENKKNDQMTVPFDVVILDQSMPKKTGREVAEVILKINPNQRIVFASAYDVTGENDSLEDFEENFEFLQKPFSLSKFVRQIGT
jgi:two-component system, cell cycle response regulator CpdR